MNIDKLTRALPDKPDLMSKLKSGDYTLHGGVIRHAAGTEKGGQIVGHLLFPSNSSQTERALDSLQATLKNGLESLQGETQGLHQSMSILQGLQSANLVVAGLNLAVTTAGFIIVCQKLNKISKQITAQSRDITQTLNLVRDVREHQLLRDEAKFRSLILSAQQFCGERNVHSLRDLVPKFHEEYQFTKLVLEKLASSATKNIDNVDNISLLQSRFVNIGLMMSHIQMKAGTHDYGRESLLQLGKDIKEINAQRVAILTSDYNIASSMSISQFSVLTSLLKSGTDIIPALNYQADIIELEATYPGLTQRASQSEEILFIAA